MKIDRLKIVLDTNIILAAISTGSPYKKVLNDFFRDQYDLYVDYEILLEYEEMLQKNFSSTISNSFINLLLDQQNLYQIKSWFQLNLISTDPDDNKFVDCAFACNAHFIVSNDKHFNILQLINFPKIPVLKIDEFMSLLENL